jgi:hypothetical protein
MMRMNMIFTDKAISNHIHPRHLRSIASNLSKGFYIFEGIIPVKINEKNYIHIYYFNHLLRAKQLLPG